VGNRLSKIYTRTGDDGSTGLGDGSRTRKDDARVEAYGTIDELNSALGIFAAAGLPEDIAVMTLAVQQKLFNLGGELCIPGSVVLTTEDVVELETELDRLNENLPPLKEFILPGGNPAAAHCHLARTICRRAERRLISLAALVDTADVNQQSVHYLNRLSDLLFVIARSLNNRDGNAEILWSGSNRTN
jgi:cob(I)alamin adenosyltransferase